MKLEVGKKYKHKHNDNRHYYIHYFEVLGIDGDMFWIKDNDGKYYSQYINEEEFVAYEEPVKEVEWKTFLVEFSDFKCIGMYLSAEAAQSQNLKALSITEIKLNFEIV